MMETYLKVPQNRNRSKNKQFYLLWPRFTDLMVLPKQDYQTNKQQQHHQKSKGCSILNEACNCCMHLENTKFLQFYFYLPLEFNRNKYIMVILDHIRNFIAHKMKTNNRMFYSKSNNSNHCFFETLNLNL